MTPVTPESPTPKRRGAPSGNLNAIKHGFYSRRLMQGEIEDLLQMEPGSVKEEIAILRVITRRVAEMADDQMPPDQILEIYNAIGAMCMRISTLLRTEAMLGGSEDSVQTMISAIDSVVEDMKRSGLIQT
jgi:hypothetical protein